MKRHQQYQQYGYTSWDDEPHPPGMVTIGEGGDLVGFCLRGGGQRGLVSWLEEFFLYLL